MLILILLQFDVFCISGVTLSTASDYRTVTSDLWRPSPIVADSPIAAKVPRPSRPTKEQLCMS